ncbi:MAG: UDP-N-acetylmuramoyl-tripeptide--D-alanyl-D-alanine ligase [Gammaproteobacteria bacterium]|nr:UDP-N-acetylmuramoyl-tripeptide--D-alanyl-D-alanine ligase [Gammaproteobacteria bacterium]
MITMPLSAAAHLLSAEHLGADVEFHGVSTDTRSLQCGNLFVALSGPNFDGHRFVPEAATKGAVAALVSERVDTALPLLVVPHTRTGMGQLAAAWRARFSLPLIAVTGSNGKTTVKEMIAAIFAQSGPVLVTHGNLNNDIGVPLTLFRLDGKQRYAVIEMGANHAGEIGYLTRLAQPTVALITNAGPAHLEGFGSIEGVAHAKGEIFGGLGAGGIAVINADDTYAALWRTLAGHHRTLSFGLTQPADVSAEWEAHADGSVLQLVTPAGRLALRLKLPGRHNVMNALAATAAALAAGAPLTDIQYGLENMQPVAGRLHIRAGRGGARIIDDSYNANPASLAAGLAVLAAQPGAKWLILGDMAELGPDAGRLHGEVGRAARAAGADQLYSVGTLSREAAQTFGPGAHHFTTQAELIDALTAALTNAVAHKHADVVTLLVKGSHSAQMERVVAALTLMDTEH